MIFICPSNFLHENSTLLSLFRTSFLPAIPAAAAAEEEEAADGAEPAGENEETSLST